MKELIEIQNELNAPKSRHNNFGNYNYRSAEDIMKAVKPLCKKHGCVLFLSDDVKEVGAPYVYNTQDTKKGTSSSYNGTRVYIEATATIINSEGQSISVKALAREEVAKAGMDASQITGAASSYARKYALNGLFAIDDSVDADRLNTTPQYTQPVGQAPVPQAPVPQTTGDLSIDDQMQYALPSIAQAMNKDDLKQIYEDFPDLRNYPAFKNALTARRKTLGINKSNEQ